MKNIIKILSVGISLFIASCSNPDVEIVEFNSSYKLDPNVTEVDMPEEFIYNPSNLIRSESGSDFLLNAMMEEGNVSIAENLIKIDFRIKRPLKKETTLKFVANDELLKRYDGDKIGFIPFPEDAFSGMEFTIPEGAKSFTTELKIKNPELLTQEPGYLSAYSLEIKSGEESDVEISKSSKVFFIKLKFSPLKDEQNIGLLNYIPREWKKIPNNTVKAKSNYASGHVYKVVDGYTGYWHPNWWVPSNGGETLYLEFPKNKIVGIVFYTYHTNESKAIKSVNIHVSEDGINYYNQGKVEPRMMQKVCVSFTKPVEISSIKFSDFISYADFIDITEVELYTEN